jgi:cell division inhibitor SulA
MAVFAVISNPSIAEVLRDPRVWRGAANDQAVAFEPSGLAALDAALPHRGWTQGAVAEILFDIDGIGELDLVLPVLAQLSRRQRHIVFVAPPYLPYAPALAARGVDLDYLHCVETQSDVEALWAAEQCLRSGVCAAVLCWPRQATDRTLRRLQVAAEFGNALGFAFRASRAAANPSPAATRIQLRTGEGTSARILKCRGANPPARSILLRAAEKEDSRENAKARKEPIQASPFLRVFAPSREQKPSLVG